MFKIKLYRFKWLILHAKRQRGTTGAKILVGAVRVSMEMLGKHRIC